MKRVVKWILLALFGSIILTLLAFLWLRRLPTERLPLPEALIDLESEEGQALLEGGISSDYKAILPFLQTQEGPTYCGVASSVSVLNTLRGAPAKLSQESLLRDRADATPPGWKVWLRGMSLDELGQILSSHGGAPEVHHADAQSVEGFREELMENAAQPSDFLIVNYSRGALLQEGGGHISPVVAYNPEADKALILDVATYKYPAVWVDVTQLFSAMETIDQSVNRARGYVVVEAQP